MTFADLPALVSPIAFFLGPIPVRWYGVFWVIGFGGAWFFVLRIWHRIVSPSCVAQERRDDLFFWILLGAWGGARLGYGILYVPEILLTNPIGFFVPLHDGVWHGFAGMSFFGGLCGVSIAIWLFLRRQLLCAFQVLAACAVAAPWAILCGRIGNFLNGELYGRITNMPWGMLFPAAPDGGVALRHPSQLYEAGLEGVFTGIVMLYALRRWAHQPMQIIGIFGITYGSMRWICEWWRFPDQNIPLLFSWMTRGHLFATILVSVGFLCVAYAYRRRIV